MTSASPAARNWRKQAWWPWLRRALLTLFLSGVAWLLIGRAREMDWPQVWRSLQHYPASVLATSALLACTSLLLYSSFDLLGRRYTGHTLRTAAVLRVTFVSYVFNLNLGALIGGFAFRYRLYSRLGLQVGQVSRVLGLSMVTNWLGYLLVAGTLFAWHPPPLPENWKIDTPLLRVLGGAMLSLGLAYLLVCLLSRKRQWRLRGHELLLPSGRMAILQAGMGAANWLLLGSIVHGLMPAPLDFATVTKVLLLAAVAGAITHVSAGLGVLETVFVSLLGSQAPGHELLAALLAYRLVYYLAPLCVAALLYIATELQARKLKTVS